MDDLVSRLTLEELVDQTLSVYDELSSGIKRLNVSSYTYRTECLHGYARRRATAFPQAINLAATFR